MVADALTVLSFCVLCINKLIPVISQVGSVAYITLNSDDVRESDDMTTRTSLDREICLMGFSCRYEMLDRRWEK